MTSIDNTIQAGVGIQQGSSTLQIKTGAKLLVGGSIEVTTGGTFTLNSSQLASQEDFAVTSGITSTAVASTTGSFLAFTSDLNALGTIVNALKANMVSLGFMAST